MRVEVAKLRARQDWSQDQLFKELVDLMHQLSARLMKDVIYLACERLDFEHIDRFWLMREELMSKELQYLFLISLKRKGRMADLQKLLHTIWTSEPTMLPSEQVLFICRWFPFLNRDRIIAVITALPIDCKWLLCSRMKVRFFRQFVDLFAKTVYPELLADNAQLFLDSQRNKPLYAEICDEEFQHKMFSIFLRDAKTLSKCPPELIDKHCQWYLDAKRCGQFTNDSQYPWCQEDYPWATYLTVTAELEHRNRRRGYYMSQQKAKHVPVSAAVLENRLLVLAKALKEDIPIFVSAEVLMTDYLIRQVGRDSVALHEVWSAWFGRLGRLLSKELSSPPSDIIAKSMCNWPCNRLLGDATKTFHGMYRNLPTQFAPEINKFFCLRHALSVEGLHLFRAYWQQELRWIDYVAQAAADVSIEVIRQASEIVCAFGEFCVHVSPECHNLGDMLLDSLHDIVKTAPTAKRFSSYPELHTHLITEFELNKIHKRLEGRNHHECAYDLAQWIEQQRENSQSPLSDNLVLRLKICDELRSLKDIDELRAALTMLAILSGGQQWPSLWMENSNSPREEAYKVTHMSPSEFSLAMENLCAPNSIELVRRAKEIIELPYDDAQTYAFTRLVLNMPGFQECESMTDDECTAQVSYAKQMVTNLCEHCSYVPLVALGHLYVYAKFYLCARAKEDHDQWAGYGSTYGHRSCRAIDLARYVEGWRHYIVLILCLENFKRFGWYNPARDCESAHFAHLTGREFSKQCRLPIQYCGKNDPERIALYAPLQLLVLQMPKYAAEEREHSLALHGLKNGVTEQMLAELEPYTAFCRKADVVNDSRSLPSRAKLVHRTHGPGRRCKACLQEYLLRNAPFSHKIYLRKAAALGIADEVFREADACAEPSQCSLHKALEQCGGLTGAWCDYFREIERPDRSQRHIVARHPPQSDPAYRPLRNPSPSIPPGRPSGVELQLMFWIRHLSRSASISSSTGLGLPKTIERIGDFLAPHQVEAVFGKILPLEAAVPLALSRQDDMAEALAILESRYLPSAELAAGAIRAITSMQKLLPPKIAERALTSANITLSQGAKAQLECRVINNPRLIKEWCLGESSQAKLERMATIDDSIRCLLVGLYRNRVDDPDVFTGLKRVCGVDVGSALNSPSSGSGSAIERLLRISAENASMPPLVAQRLKQFALVVVADDRPLVVSAALASIQLTRSSGKAVEVADADAAVIHARKVPDLDYLMMMRSILPFRNVEVIREYVDFMREQRFSRPSMNIWTIGALHRLQQHLSKKDAGSLDDHEADESEENRLPVEAEAFIDRTAAAARVIFGGERGNIVTSTKALIPAYAWMKGRDYY